MYREQKIIFFVTFIKLRSFGVYKYIVSDVCPSHLTANSDQLSSSY